MPTDRQAAVLVVYRFAEKHLTWRARTNPTIASHREDLLQECWIAIDHAFDLYDPTRGMKWEVFGSMHFRSCIQKHVSRLMSLVSVGANVRRVNPKSTPVSDVYIDRVRKAGDGEDLPSFLDGMAANDDVENATLAREATALVEARLRAACASSPHHVDWWLANKFGDASQTDIGAAAGVTKQAVDAACTKVRGAFNRLASELRGDLERGGAPRSETYPTEPRAEA